MNRHELWIAASAAAGRIEPFMMVVIQGLGRLDISLTDADQSFLRLSAADRESLFQSFALNERFTLSYLWVLGGYELVRTVCQRLTEAPHLVSPEVNRAFVELKRKFNRLRIPLAKMEPAGSHKSTDSHIAYPALNLDHGIAWQVAADVYITRQELSDALLNTLQTLRPTAPVQPPPSEA